MKKVSIIIPSYNEEKTIEKILNKVESVDLSYFKLEKEIIIVDDGSIDATREILEKHREKHKLIFHEKNKGKGAQQLEMDSMRPLATLF